MKMTLQQKIVLAEKARQKFEKALQLSFGERCHAVVQIDLFSASPALYHAAPDNYQQYERKTGGGEFCVFCMEPENRRLTLYK